MNIKSNLLENKVDLQVTEAVAEAHGCTVDFKWRTPHYLPTVNAPETTLAVEQLAKSLVGDKNWISLEAPSMGGEDFSFIASKSAINDS